MGQLRTDLELLKAKEMYVDIKNNLSIKILVKGENGIFLLFLFIKILDSQSSKQAKWRVYKELIVS